MFSYENLFSFEELTDSKESKGVFFLGRNGGGGNPKTVIDPRSLGSRCIKGTDESSLGKDSSVPLMLRHPSDLESMIRFRIFPKNAP